VGAELFHADRQTDRPTLMVTLRNFVNEPKNVLLYTVKRPLTIREDSRLNVFKNEEEKSHNKKVHNF
jgi:hypothetical protein